MTTQLTPMFRLADLGLDAAALVNVEAYLAEHLVELEHTQELSRISGLDANDVRQLGSAIRRLYQQAPKVARRPDPGLQRLLKAVGEQAEHVDLGPGFYAATLEQEATVRLMFEQQHGLYCLSLAVRCLTLCFGMDGHRVHTYAECARRLSPNIKPFEVQVVVQKNLQALAKRLVPQYALTLFDDPRAIPLDYLQLSPRLRNLLLRADEFETAGDITRHTQKELKAKVDKFGPRSRAELTQALSYCGLELAEG